MSLLHEISISSAEKEVCKLVQKALKRGVICFWFLYTPNSFRIAPPLTISAEEIEISCRRLIECLDEL
jgi:4-aminobutyrate aminotransferase-like enzyme